MRILFASLLILLCGLVACSENAEARYAKDSLEWLMAKHIKALGGAKALNAVKSRATFGVSEGVEQSGAGFDTKWRYYGDRDGRTYNESFVRRENSETYELQHKMAVTPSGGWAIMGTDKGVVDYPAELAAGIAKDRVVLSFDYPVRYQTLPAQYDFKRLPDVTEEGKLYHVTRMGAGDNTITQYFDSETYLTVRWVTTTKYETISTESYSDFREVDGMMIPFTIISSMEMDSGDTLSTQTMRIEKVVFNPEYEPALFERPTIE